MTDYAEPLKRAWKACPCQLEIEICGYAQPVLGNIMCDCNIRGSQTSKPIKCENPLHAALLAMVHAYVMAQVPYTFDAARIERRLRTSVGVSNG